MFDFSDSEEPEGFSTIDKIVVDANSALEEPLSNVSVTFRNFVTDEDEPVIMKNGKFKF